MSKSNNEAFLNAYVSADKICCEKFGITKYGITEYITRLNNARFAPMRDEVLPTLVKYRSVRNTLVHEVDALADSNEITKTDVKWMKGFEKQLDKRKDPLSAYLRKAHRHKRLRKLRNVLLALLAVAAASAAVYAIIRFIF
jgi:hypothetical protein